MEQSHPRRVAVQRWALNERRQELASLTRLRADLGRQLAQLDQAGDEPDEGRRERLQESIRLVEAQIVAARGQVDSAQRVLRRLEKSAAQTTSRRRRAKPQPAH